MSTTLCALNGQICKPGTPATVALLKKGKKIQHFDVCDSCSRVLAEQQEALRADPATRDQVVEITVASMAKVEAFRTIGAAKGEGLTVRTDKGGTVVCSGPGCQNNRISKSAIVVKDCVYDLCGSCSVAAWVAATRDNNPTAFPVKREIAVAKAKRFAADKAEKECGDQAKAVHAAIVSKKTGALNAILLDEPEAPRPKRPQDLPIVGHLEDRRGLRPTPRTA